MFLFSFYLHSSIHIYSLLFQNKNMPSPAYIPFRAGVYPCPLPIRKSLRPMDSSSSSLQLTLTATLKGHNGAVTAIATPADATQNFIVSASRGKK